MPKTEILLKTAAVYLFYFLYTYLGGYITGLFTNIDHNLISMGLDIIFLIFIVGMYFQKIKADLKKIKQEIKISHIIKTVLIGIAAYIGITIVLMLISSIFHLNRAVDQNTGAIHSLPLYYAIFKTMIFGSIAEELLFRESLNECIKDNKLFILISAIIYTAILCVFQGSGIAILQMIQYFLSAVILSSIYIKNKRNILIAALAKFTYNLIPLTILLLGI